MAELLKDTISDKYLNDLTRALRQVYPKLSPQFKKNLKAGDWDDLALKQRLTRISETLRSHLPSDYSQALPLLLKAAPQFGGYEALYFPEFVATYGRDSKHRKISQQALLELTQYSSSELAVRPFILDRPGPMMTWMLKNAKHKNFHIRRLASEGCRPRLPWAPQLKFLMEDPTPILPILEQLKSDPELYVRKSVANNINDITKDNPKAALQLVSRWMKNNPTPETQWIVRHGLRSLVKQGNPKALKLLGFAAPKSIQVDQFKIDKKKLKLGEEILITVEVTNITSRSQNVVLDYVLHHMKQNGQTTPKVFKGSNFKMAPKESLILNKRHRIRPISTRRYYSGQHWVQVQINGQPGLKRPFNLQVP